MIKLSLDGLAAFEEIDCRMADKPKSPIIILTIVLSVFVDGCHKPSTRLQKQIQFCQDVELNLPQPQDADPKLILDTYINMGTDLKLNFSKDSREYQVFNSFLGEYDSYSIMLSYNRKRIEFYQGLYQTEVHNYGYGNVATGRAADLKKETDKDSAEESQEYQLVKDKAKEAEEILEKIQVNE